MSYLFNNFDKLIFMPNAKNPHRIRYPVIIYLKNLPKDIKIWFYVAVLTVLFIELIGKRFSALNHTFYILGDIWLKLCYSLCAAIIFYVINQHLPRQKRKLKSITFLSSKLVGINMELILLAHTMSKDFIEQDLSKLTKQWVEEKCSKINQSES